MSRHLTELSAFCRRVLGEGGLETKLEAPSEALTRDFPPLIAKTAGDAPPERPARQPRLALRDGTEKLPPLRALADPAQRRRCLERFAHHELMAVEMLAWAILRWPGAPAELRRDWLLILRDEQRHCRLYLERLAAHGGALGDEPLSGYLWKQIERIDGSGAGMLAFLAGLGLTLEQANLDFTLYYAAGFRRVGDAESADVLEEVHRDEIRHVDSARSWLARLSPERDETRRYELAVPFPLSASRAKGRDFQVGARRRAGLGEAFIEHVRGARASSERAGSGG